MIIVHFVLYINNNVCAVNLSITYCPRPSRLAPPTFKIKDFTHASVIQLSRGVSSRNCCTYNTF